MKPIVKITDWEFFTTSEIIFNVPSIKQRLGGIVKNHPNVQDDKRVITSSLIAIDLFSNKVETKNTIYLLEGPPNEQYLEYLKSINHHLYYSYNIVKVLN